MSQEIGDELLEILTTKLRVLSEAQIARTWGMDADSLRSLLESLETDKLINRISLLCHPEIELSEPVLRWTPGDEEPDLGAIAYQLQSRWSEPSEAVSCVNATVVARNRYGGYIGGRRPRVSETTHDLHLAQVFLRLRDRSRDEARAWISEHQQQAEGAKKSKLPDAILRLEQPRVIDFGGSYPKAKLQSFHEANRESSYEIW